MVYLTQPDSKSSMEDFQQLLFPLRFLSNIMKVCLYLELEDKLRYSGIGSAIANQRKALDLNGIPYTSNLRDDFDLIHINLMGPKSLYIAKKMRKKGKKVIIHAHLTADDFRNSYRFSNLIAPFLKHYLAYCYNQADLVLCPSEYTKKILRGYGVRREICVISNGVDIKKFSFSERKRKEFREKFELCDITPLSVGHLFIRKGISTFIETAREFKNQFIWIGKRYKNIEDKRVSELIKNSPSNVRFINYIEDVVSAYSGSDIFFFPSYCENQGIVLLEAAACSRPILVRDIPTYSGWLRDEFNCLKAKTDEEFKIQMRRLLNDEWLRERLSKNAHKLALKHSLENIGRKLKEIYEFVLRE